MAGHGATANGEDESLSRFLDTSVLLASLDPDEPHHAACDKLLAVGGHRCYLHALAETFAILTGGRQGRRIGASVAAELIEHSVLPYARPQALSTREVMTALTECERRGVRGGAVYDWLHLAAARKAGAEVLVTLDMRDFQALVRAGDPRIEVPYEARS